MGVCESPKRSGRESANDRLSSFPRPSRASADGSIVQVALVALWLRVVPGKLKRKPDPESRQVPRG